MWTIGCDVLIVVGKYLKKFNRWFDVHAWIFMAIGITSGLLSISSGKKKDYRVLQDGDLSSGEKLVLTSWAKKETHNTLGQIANILTYVLIIQGLVLRFMIAVQKRYKHL
jgi:hypothetical protein